MNSEIKEFILFFVSCLKKIILLIISNLKKSCMMQILQIIFCNLLGEASRIHLQHRKQKSTNN